VARTGPTTHRPGASIGAGLTARVGVGVAWSAGAVIVTSILAAVKSILSIVDRFVSSQCRID
jgi:hypothetical protein